MGADRRFRVHLPGLVPVGGDIVPVEIVASQEYDLIGVAAGKPCPRRSDLPRIAEISTL